MIGTASLKVTVCQPDPVSLVKVAVASAVPSAFHSVPVWVPVLAALFRNRTPVTQASVAALNRTPSSVGVVSASAARAGCSEAPNSPHGQLAETATWVGLPCRLPLSSIARARTVAAPEPFWS